MAGEQGVAGRIHPGMRADLTGLVVDPIDSPPEDLPDIGVWLTVVGGRVVYGGTAVTALACARSFEL